MQWRKTLSNARKNYHQVPYRLLSYADAWIFLNLALAIAISVPAWNYYTHGTHITVAHAMGATIGINTMILFASVFYILQNVNPEALEQKRKWIGPGILLTNIALVFFWISLLGSGAAMIAGKLNNKTFYEIMQNCQPWFKIFAYSGIVILVGLVMMIINSFIILRSKNVSTRNKQEALVSSKELVS